jgi:DNA-binding MarR family transcriptional regulator
LRTRRKTDTSELATWEEVDLFRAFLTAYVRVTKALEAELVAEDGLSLAEFDVFVQLNEAPNRSMRMTELADRLLISRSGASRLVERLEQNGLVSRERANGDGRGIIATLTDAGRRRLRAAAVVHRRGIKEHFTSQLKAAEFVALSQICAQLTNNQPDVPTV